MNRKSSESTVPLVTGQFISPGLQAMQDIGARLDDIKLELRGHAPWEQMLMGQFYEAILATCERLFELIRDEPPILALYLKRAGCWFDDPWVGTPGFVLVLGCDLEASWHNFRVALDRLVSKPIHGVFGVAPYFEILTATEGLEALPEETDTFICLYRYPEAERLLVQGAEEANG